MSSAEKEVETEALQASVRVFLAQELLMEREIVGRHLAPLSDFQVVGETGDWVQVPLVCERVQPDVLVLDFHTRTVVLDTIRVVRKRLPATGIVVVSETVEPKYVGRILAAGALALVDKRIYDPEDFDQAIRMAASGERYISPTVYPALVEAAIQALIEEGAERYFLPYERLTLREREVLGLVAEGCTNGEIAGRLFLSLRTVEKHKANISQKLGVRGVAGMVRFAVERELGHEGEGG